jgi:hypothetical protein
MRFVLMALADEGEEAVVPRPALERYGADLVRAGVLLAAESLEPAAAGACVRFDGELRTLSRPAIGTTNRFWMLETACEEEALEWARRLPFTSGTVEVRRVTGDEGR